VTFEYLNIEANGALSGTSEKLVLAYRAWCVNHVQYIHQGKHPSIRAVLPLGAHATLEMKERDLVVGIVREFLRT
jgi:hypothetical protein